MKFTAYAPRLVRIGVHALPRPREARSPRVHRLVRTLGALLVMLVVESAPGASQSLFPDTRQGNDSGPEGTPYELGVIFRANTPGKVTHLRVYALASESGSHSARLWRNLDGALLAGPFSWNYGGIAGWTQLDIPDVTITPDTDYTVSVSTGAGGRNYPFASGDLGLPGGNGLNLTYPAGAGVFTTTPGQRPTGTFQNANYFRDIVFEPDSVAPPTNGPVTLTEFMAHNTSGLRDEDGDTSDWIEIYNPAVTPVPLAGYQLVGGPTSWTFPSVTLGPQQFLVVFASGKDRTNPPAPLHTNFKLNPSGEYLALLDAAHQVVSEFAPAFPAQHPDYSAGFGPTGTVVYFFTPTPGAPNSPSFSGFVEDLSVSVPRGFFTAPVRVAITTPTPDAVIYYTLDGSLPADTGARVYTEPLTLTNTTTLRARGVRPGFLPTRVHTGTYLFLDDVTQQSVESARRYGWPEGPINGQELRLGIKPAFASLYTRQALIDALTQIPSVSLVTDQRHLTDPSTGLYVNPSGSGPAWERPVSFELLNPDGAAGFQADCGIRIRGGQSSSPNFPKHSFHIFFRGDYGEGTLRFPLFGAAGAGAFDTIDLRCEHGYAYADPYPYSDEFTAIRDVFCRNLWASTGYASTRSRPYHLYLNGQYWGLYQSQERAQEDYASSYFGGQAADYDVIKATGLPETTIEVSSGDSTNWMRLWAGARAVATEPTDANYYALLGRNPDATPNPSLPVLLDPHELATYMLVHYYTGHADEPLSVSFNWEKPNNFRAVRRRGMAEPWHFFVHDGESSMMAPEWFDDRANAVNLTSPNRTNFVYSNPEWIHEDLMAHPDYRTVFWDEAQRLLFNDGPMTSARARAIWDALAAQVDHAVIGESVRWGNDLAKARQSVWAAKVAQVRTNFFPTRAERLVAQLRKRNQYPPIDAPRLSSPGGLVPSGFTLWMTNPVPGATLYFTRDGSDPRAPGGAVDTAAIAYTPDTPVVINGTTRIRARVHNPAGWSAGIDATFYPAQDFTRLQVSEIMYHPPDAGTLSGDNLEFVELRNSGTTALDLGGVSFTEGITFTFTNGTVMAPGELLVLGRNPAALRARYPGLAVYGTYSGKLNNGGERLTLTHALGSAILSFEYKNSAPWPVTPDGWGFSLVPRDPEGNPDPGSPLQWRSSAHVGGSPGADDPEPGIPPVKVNEALTLSLPPDLDAVELFNPAAQPADIGGWFLTDDPLVPRKFRIPDGTRLNAGGFQVFTEADFNTSPLSNPAAFSLNSSGDQLFLFSADSAGNLTGYSHGFAFGGSAPGTTFGLYRTSTGDEDFVAQATPTLGAPNSGPRVGPVVLRQILYHPPDLAGGQDDTPDEFVALLNITPDPVALFDPAAPTNTWHIRGGIGFDFPTNLVIPPAGGLVLVSFDPADPAARAAFRDRYPRFRSTPILGPYSGKLDNSQDTVELNRPGTPSANGIPRIVVDRVTYRDSDPWPPAADGGGASLGRKPPPHYGNDPANWAPSTPVTFLTQPIAWTARPGSNLVFTATAIGEGVLSYQWRLNDIALTNGGAYSGVDTPTLVISQVAATHRGDYTLFVTAADESAPSRPATLTVLVPPAIVVAPQPITVVEGDAVVLAVQVAGAATLPLSYEWWVDDARVQSTTTDSPTSTLGYTAATTVPITTNHVRVVIRNAAIPDPDPGVSSDTVAVVILQDSDGDHVPDAWTLRYFGHPTGQASDLSRASDDADGDSATNLAEFLAGTDPRDASSQLRIAIVSGDAGLALRFQPAADRSYTLQVRDLIQGGPWRAWLQVASSTQPQLVEVPLPAAEQERYFRLITPQQP